MTTLSGDLIAPFFAAVAEIESDFNQQEVLIAALGRSSGPEVVTQVINATQRIESDHSQAEVLLAAIHRGLTPEQQTLLRSVARGIESDYDRARVLTGSTNSRRGSKRVEWGRRALLRLSSTLLTLLACQQAAPPQGEHEWRALGTEPFWHLEVTASGLRFTTPDDTMGIIVPPLPPRQAADTLRWTGETERTAFDVRIWPVNCSDGMSDKTWPATALVEIDQKTWKGCAEPIPKHHLGNWRVTGHQAPGISAMPSDTAATWVGRTAEYSRTRTRFGTEECDGPRYFPSTLSAEGFAAEFGVPVHALGLEAPLMVITVRCRDGWTGPGTRLLVRNPDLMLTPWDGVFFELQRVR